MSSHLKLFTFFPNMFLRENHTSPSDVRTKLYMSSSMYVRVNEIRLTMSQQAEYKLLSSKTAKSRVVCNIFLCCWFVSAFVSTFRDMTQLCTLDTHHSWLRFFCLFAVSLLNLADYIDVPTENQSGFNDDNFQAPRLDLGQPLLSSVSFFLMKFSRPNAQKLIASLSKLSSE